MTNPLVADEAGLPVAPWAGLWLLEDIDAVSAAVRSRSWVDASIGAASAGLDALAPASDPLGALMQYGVAWIIEHVAPLSEALDRLAGDPAAGGLPADHVRGGGDRLARGGHRAGGGSRSAPCARRGPSGSRGG